MCGCTMWMAARSCTLRRRELLLTALSGISAGGRKRGGRAADRELAGRGARRLPAKSATAVAAVTTANKTAAAIGREVDSAPMRRLVPPVRSAHAYLVATVNAIPLRTIMEVTETEGLRRPGLRHGGDRAGEGGVGRAGGETSRTR